MSVFPSGLESFEDRGFIHLPLHPAQSVPRCLCELWPKTCGRGHDLFQVLCPSDGCFFFSQKKSLHIKSYIELHKEVNVNLLTFFCLFFSSGPNRGHYITIVKSHGFWLLFDDDIVEVGMQMIISKGGGAETVFWDVCMWTFSKIGLHSCHLTWKQLTFLSELHSAAPYPLWKGRRGVIMDPSVLCAC